MRPDILAGPDLGPNCLQRLSVDDTSRQRVKQKNNITELFAYWIILHAFLSSADFLQNQLFEKSFQEYHQARHFVRPDLGPNCLQRLSVLLIQ